MPAGKHKGVRVALAVPEGIYNQLDQWAEAEGRAIASLCMSLVEQGLRQAVMDGIAPSVIQTKVNDPLINTKEGVTAHRMTEEELEQAKQRKPKFGQFVREVNEKEVTEEEKNLYDNLSNKDKQSLIQGLLSSMMGDKE